MEEKSNTLPVRSNFLLQEVAFLYFSLYHSAQTYYSGQYETVILNYWGLVSGVMACMPIIPALGKQER
jgi:hypothetical protein